MPIPLFELTDERLALSKDDLYIKLIPSLSVIVFKNSAVSSAIFSDSIAHGPEIRVK